ncbi:MAG: DnaJ domain-containing protein [Bacteroidia bacterium]
MPTQNLYQTLLIPDYSDIALIKKGFRQLALQLHPDRNPNPEAAEKFKTIVNAYEVLSNPQLKQQYDLRLKSGFSFASIPNVPNESEFELKRQHYARMRKERDEMQEIENIMSYENSLKTVPFKWRLTLTGLLLFTGIISFVNDWYTKQGKIALGFFLFLASSIFLWNELYKHFWYKSLVKDEQKYYRQATSRFLTIFFIGIFSIYSLVKIKKIWHLHNFGTVIYAELDAFKHTISFTYNESAYIFSIPDKDNYSHKVLIRISSKEPEIWEFVEE